MNVCRGDPPGRPNRHARHMTLLVIDLGSSSARTLLFDDDARLIDGSICSRRHDFSTDSGGLAIADAPKLRRLVEACIDEALQHPAARADPRRGSWRLSPATGSAWTKLARLARRCSPMPIPAGAARFRRCSKSWAAMPMPYHQATGCRLHPAYLPAQFAHLQATDPAAEGRVRRIADIGGYCYRRWFGRDMPMSLSVASWSGLLDTIQRDWHWEYARRLLGAQPGGETAARYRFRQRAGRSFCGVCRALAPFARLSLSSSRLAMARPPTSARARSTPAASP